MKRAFPLIAAFAIVAFAIVALAGCDMLMGAKGKDGAAGMAGMAGSNGGNGLDATMPIVIAPIANAGFGLSADGAVIVSVGGSGAIYTSVDAKAWTSRTSTTSYQLNAVANGGGVFVAVGNSGTILRSLDSGGSWTAATTPNTGLSDNLTSVAYGAGAFVAVGYNGTNGVLLRSPDGDTWTVATPAAAAAFGSASFANGSFFAGTSTGGSLYSSADGSAWSSPMALPGISTTKIVGVAYGNGIYLASDDSWHFLSSPDGANWTALNIGIGSGKVAALAFGENRFVFMPNSGGPVYWTYEGSAWYPYPILPTLIIAPGYTSILWVPWLGTGTFVLAPNSSLG